MLHQARAGSMLGAGIRANILRASSSESWLCQSWSVAVKRSSTWGTKRRAAKSIGRCTWESDSPEGARFGSRLQKLVKRIFPVKTACGATRSRHDWIA